MDFGHGNGSSKHSRTGKEESDGSGSSKHSGRDLEFVVGSRNSRHLSEGSGSSKHSSRHLELDDEAGSSEQSSEGSASSKHSRRHLELDVESGSSKHSESNHFEINPEIIKIHPGVIDGSESSKRSEEIQEEIDRIEGDILVSTEKLRLSSSSSSSSSDSSTDGQDIELSKSRSGIASTSSLKPDEDVQQSLKDKYRVYGNNSFKLDECQNGSGGPALTSQVSSVTHESTLTESPPIQVMDRQGEFDPGRIPSAVFARSRSTTPMDWSVASNESLFSIQVGNNSFSKDHVLNLKSGELFKSGEFIAISPSPIAPGVDTDKKSVELGKSEATLVSEDAVKDNTGPSAEEPIAEKPTQPVVSWNSSNISSHFDNSLTSVQSHAFPIKNKKKKKQKKCAWPSCFCSNCSWEFCYCTRPSCHCSNCSWAFCYCTRPSCHCSNCSWAFCYGWNCSIKRWCCHFCTNLSNGRNVSQKEKTEQQQQQQQKQPLASAAPSKSACCNCCFRFPSCRWRWNWSWGCRCNCRNCCRQKCC